MRKVVSEPFSVRYRLRAGLFGSQFPQNMCFTSINDTVLTAATAAPLDAHPTAQTNLFVITCFVSVSNNLKFCKSNLGESVGIDNKNLYLLIKETTKRLTKTKKIKGSRSTLHCRLLVLLSCI